ncbi:hypothetical protein GQ43DRAFT_486845 [Delitschia confertaspora ATCC 74209]|uniref:Mpv17 / PMP22 family protein n=1 Tax=Delitschia confertaspora ATCC 74209 TaxID=1513339 RepID=A0A9P4JQX8_9PLEO|nr:hypothetical protein GQ43DRAFT_486845 [Delitschia confertaspora ATCC 74209]
MFRWYQAKLRSSPLLTQSATTAVLFATGDVLAQQGVERVGVEKHDYIRTARMGLYGGAVFGPVVTTWYKQLQKISLSTTNRTILARVACDQLIFTPIHMGVFLSTMSVLEGSSAREKLSKAYQPALVNNWLLWPWVQLVNFRWVPLEHRVLLVNFVSLGWNCYLSYLNSSK